MSGQGPPTRPLAALKGGASDVLQQTLTAHCRRGPLMLHETLNPASFPLDSPPSYHPFAGPLICAAEEARAAAAQAKAQAKAQAAAASVSDLTKALKSQGGAPSPPSGKSVIPSFASLVPDIPGPTPSSVAAAAKSFSLRRGSGTTSGTTDGPKARRPLRQRSESKPKAKPAPAPAPAAAAPPQKVEKNKILGGLLGEQDTIYVDEDY